MLRKVEEIQEVINGAVREVLGNPTLKIEPDTMLISELGLESIDFVDIIFEIEQRLKTEIDLNLFASSLDRFKETRFNDFKMRDLVEFVSSSMSGDGQR